MLDYTAFMGMIGLLAIILIIPIGLILFGILIFLLVKLDDLIKYIIKLIRERC